MKGMGSWRRRHFGGTQGGEENNNGEAQKAGAIKCVVWNVHRSKHFGEMRAFLEKFIKLK